MLKIISINIERDKRHSTVIPFLIKESPDVVCLQEVFEDELAQYTIVLGMKSFFKPMCHYKISNSNLEERKILGVAILYKSAIDFSFKYIWGEEDNIPIFVQSKNFKTDRNIISIVLIWVNIIDSNGLVYKIANTHFTWTSDGHPTPFQIDDMKNMIPVLDEELKEFVLFGDLNSPRGFETFGMLEKKYKDNIPKKYDSSIDPRLHRVPGLKYMVDCVFSTSNYFVKDVKLIEGVSDHKAVVAYIEKI